MNQPEILFGLSNQGLEGIFIAIVLFVLTFTVLVFWGIGQLFNNPQLGWRLVTYGLFSEAIAFFLVVLPDSIIDFSNFSEFGKGEIYFVIATVFFVGYVLILELIFRYGLKILGPDIFINFFYVALTSLVLGGLTLLGVLLINSESSYKNRDRADEFFVNEDFENDRVRLGVYSCDKRQWDTVSYAGQTVDFVIDDQTQAYCDFRYGTFAGESDGSFDGLTHTCRLPIHIKELFPQRRLDLPLSETGIDLSPLDKYCEPI